jgi:hypothetical protein
VPFGADHDIHRQDVVDLHPPRSPVARAGRWPLAAPADRALARGGCGRLGRPRHHARDRARARRQRRARAPLGWRIALGLLSAGLLVFAAFLPWLETARGQCTSGAVDEDCLRYDVFLNELANRTTLNQDVGSFTGIVNVLASAGTGAIVLAVLVLLGLRTGALAWFAGLAAVVAAIVFHALGASGAGVSLLLLAGLLATASGVLATITARGRG